MRRYFFDIDDRGRQVRDKVGFDLEDDCRALREANLLTYQLAGETKLDPRNGTVTVSVRNEQGDCIYEASLSLADD